MREGPLGVRITDGDENLSLVVVHDKDGLAVLPAFTSEDALRRWRPAGSPYVGLVGHVVVGLLAESDWDRMVVDGADASTELVISRAAARRMSGVEEVAVQAGSTVVVAEPAVGLPEGMRDALCRACQIQSLISEAYFVQMAVGDGEQMPHLTIGLSLARASDETEAYAIVRAIASEVEPDRWGLEFVDLIVLDGGLLDTVRALGPPVYYRADADDDPSSLESSRGEWRQMNPDGFPAGLAPETVIRQRRDAE
jgi:hypothetical protein